MSWHLFVFWKVAVQCHEGHCTATSQFVCCVPMLCCVLPSRLWKTAPVKILSRVQIDLLAPPLQLEVFREDTVCSLSIAVPFFVGCTLSQRRGRFGKRVCSMRRGCFGGSGGQSAWRGRCTARRPSGCVGFGFAMVVMSPSPVPLDMLSTTLVVSPPPPRASTPPSWHFDNDPSSPPSLNPRPLPRCADNSQRRPCQRA